MIQEGWSDCEESPLAHYFIEGGKAFCGQYRAICRTAESPEVSIGAEANPHCPRCCLILPQLEYGLREHLVNNPE